MQDDLPTAEVLKVKILEESEARKQTSGNVVTAMVAGNRKNRNFSSKENSKSTQKTGNFKCFKAGFWDTRQTFVRQEDLETQNLQIQLRIVSINLTML